MASFKGEGNISSPRSNWYGESAVTVVEGDWRGLGFVETGTGMALYLSRSSKSNARA